MTLVTTLDGGIDVFQCPDCGRMMAITYPPNYKKVILIPGSTTEIHSAGKGGLTITDAQVQNDDLTDWEKFLNDMNFDELWKGGQK